MIKKEVISGRQLILLVFTFIIATGTLFLPAFVTKHAEQDAWISVLLGGMVGVVVVFVVTFLGLRYPKMTLIEYSETILGKWPGKLVGLIYILFYLHMTSIMIREVSATIKQTLLPRTSLEVITFIIFIAGVVAVKLGLEVITRANVINLVITYIAMFIVLFLLLKIMNIELLTPILGNGLRPVIQDSVSPAGWFGEVVSIAFLIPFVNKPKEARSHSIIGVLWASVTLSIIVALSIMLFGPKMTSILTFPTLDAVRQINISDYVQRLEIIFLIPWIISNLVKVSFFYYVTELIISKWFKIENGKSLVLPVGIVLGVMSLVLFNSSIELQAFLSQVWGFYSLPVELGIPIFLLIIEIVRSKKRGDCTENL
jgi:spore germination protein KB